MNREIYNELSRLRTSDLLVARMDAVTTGSFWLTLKSGTLGMIAMCVGHLSTTLFSAKVLGIGQYLVLMLTLYSTAGLFVCDRRAAQEKAKSELINELLTLRQNRTGTGKSLDKKPRRSKG